MGCKRILSNIFYVQFCTWLHICFCGIKGTSMRDVAYLYELYIMNLLLIPLQELYVLTRS